MVVGACMARRQHLKARQEGSTSFDPRSNHEVAGQRQNLEGKPEVHKRLSPSTLCLTASHLTIKPQVGATASLGRPYLEHLAVEKRSMAVRLLNWDRV